MPKHILFMSIVDRGRAEQILQEIQGFGLGRGIVLYGEGTSPNRWLNVLGLDQTEKEILLLPASQDLDVPLHEWMLRRFKLNKRRRGIALTLPLSRFQQARPLDANQAVPLEQTPFHLLVTILDHGRSSDYLAVTRELGVHGGTFIRGHGAGVPNDTLLSGWIEPQKDIAFCLAPTDRVRHLQTELMQQLELSEPGSGILFALPVLRATGLYQEKGGGR